MQEGPHRYLQLEKACARFPFNIIAFPDASALTSLSEALTVSNAFSAKPVLLSAELFHEPGDSLS